MFRLCCFLFKCLVCSSVESSGLEFLSGQDFNYTFNFLKQVKAYSGSLFRSK